MTTLQLVSIKQEQSARACNPDWWVIKSLSAGLVIEYVARWEEQVRQSNRQGEPAGWPTDKTKRKGRVSWLVRHWSHHHHPSQSSTSPTTTSPCNLHSSLLGKTLNCGWKTARYIPGIFFSITIQIYYCIINELLVAASRNRCFLYFNIWLAELSYDTRYLLLNLCGPHNSANWSHEWLAIFSPL